MLMSTQRRSNARGVRVDSLRPLIQGKTGELFAELKKKLVVQIPSGVRCLGECLVACLTMLIFPEEERIAL